MTNNTRGYLLVRYDGKPFWYRPVGEHRTMIRHANGSETVIENSLARAPDDVRPRFLDDAEVLAWLKSLYESTAPKTKGP